MSELPEQYKHSSAKYYLTGAQSFYKVDNVAEMNDKVFVQSVNTIVIDATVRQVPTLLRSRFKILKQYPNASLKIFWQQQFQVYQNLRYQLYLIVV